MCLTVTRVQATPSGNPRNYRSTNLLLFRNVRCLQEFMLCLNCYKGSGDIRVIDMPGLRVPGFQHATQGMVNIFLLLLLSL